MLTGFNLVLQRPDRDASGPNRMDENPAGLSLPKALFCLGMADFFKRILNDIYFMLRDAY
jgi:hypothetical protein